MNPCEYEHNRKIYRIKPTTSITAHCNRVECIKVDGTKCECWMSFPNIIDQPYHNKQSDIIINMKRIERAIKN